MEDCVIWEDSLVAFTASGLILTDLVRMALREARNSYLETGNRICICFSTGKPTDRVRRVLRGRRTFVTLTDIWLAFRSSA